MKDDPEVQVSAAKTPGITRLDTPRRSRRLSERSITPSRDVSDDSTGEETGSRVSASKRKTATPRKAATSGRASPGPGTPKRTRKSSGETPFTVMDPLVEEEEESQGVKESETQSSAPLTPKSTPTTPRRSGRSTRKRLSEAPNLDVIKEDASGEIKTPTAEQRASEPASELGEQNETLEEATAVIRYGKIRSF